MARGKAQAAVAEDSELSERLEALREGVGDIDAQIRDTVRERPLACLVGALAAGYLVGRLVARS